MPRTQTRNTNANRPAAKLDMYDYRIVPTEKEGFDIIKVKVQSNRDITIADISGEIVSHDNLIYLEGRRYWYLTSFVSEDPQTKQVYFDIHVRRTYKGEYHNDTGL